MQEIRIENIPLAGDKVSNGTLLTNNNKSLIITAHGLGGNAGNYMNLKLRDHVAEKGLAYDVFRFGFYDFNNNQRNFLETTVASQIGDLGSIINHFADKYDKIYLLATSYGGLTAAALNSDKLTKQFLIDPSFVIDTQWQQATNKEIAGNIVNYDRHIPFLFNPAMQEEGLAWSAEKSQAIINNINLPTLLIQANSLYYKIAAHLDYSNPNIEATYMENADHEFNRLGSCDEMLDKVFKFITK